MVFFLCANFQRSQKHNYYEAYWHTLFQECFWSHSETLQHVFYWVQNHSAAPHGFKPDKTLHLIFQTSHKYFLILINSSAKLLIKYWLCSFSSGHQNERHTRQLKDITTHFECEIHKFYEQLNSVGSGLLALQDALPFNMLQATNHKLEARCNGLEKACEQMKNKSAKLEQSNQALDNDCRQLRQINQNLEVRCLYLDQVSQASEKDKTQLQRNIHDLEDKVKDLAASNEQAIGACCQLEELNQKCATKIQTIEESKKLLESRYKSCVSENEKLENQIGQCQQTVDQYKK